MKHATSLLALLLLLTLCANAARKQRITERGSSLFYRSWRYPIVDDAAKDTSENKTKEDKTNEAITDSLLKQDTENGNPTPQPNIATADTADKGGTPDSTAVTPHEGDATSTDSTQNENGAQPILPEVCIVHFQFDKDQYIRNYEAEMDTLIAFINYHKGKRFLIEGHTDERGTVAYNQQLSERRARQLARSLAQRGVEASRLETVGRSELRPAVAHAKNEREHQLNRRCEIHVIKP